MSHQHSGPGRVQNLGAAKGSLYLWTSGKELRERRSFPNLVHCVVTTGAYIHILFHI